MKTTARVVLSGGAALGLAQIGALQVIDTRFKISGIIGTSMGAIIGGLFACGYNPEKLLQIALVHKKNSLFNPLTLDRTLTGIFDGKKITRLFEEWTNNKLIEDCRIPFLAVSYDLIKRNTVIINRGSLAYAMRASSSIPYIFSPFKWGKYSFVDGGIEYPLPLGLSQSLPGEITIAVNVLPSRLKEPEIIDSMSIDVSNKKLYLNEVFLRSVAQNQAYIAMHSIVDNKPDLVIDAWYPRGNVFGFDQAETYYHWGIAKAEEALSKYEHPNYLEKMRKKYKKLVSRLSTGFQHSDLI